MSHIILVAFEVDTPNRADAHEALQARLVPLLKSKDDTSPIECWWVAEDDRRDGSDNDSAVFVHPGAQPGASRALHTLGLTHSHNVIGRSGGQFSGTFDPFH